MTATVVHRVRATIEGRVASLPLTVTAHNRVVVEPPRVRRCAPVFACAPGSGLALPGPWSELAHPISWILAGVHQATLVEDPVVMVVGHATSSEPTTLAAARSESLRCIVEDDADAWVALATDTGSIRDIKAYLQYLNAVHGWACHVDAVDASVGPSTAESVEAFQAEYNEVFDASILVDGICGEETLEAIFRMLRFEWDKWLFKHDLAQDRVDALGIRFMSGADAPQTSAAIRVLADQPCVDVLVLERADLDGHEGSPALVYGSKTVRLSPYEVPEEGFAWARGNYTIVTDLIAGEVVPKERYTLRSTDVPSTRRRPCPTTRSMLGCWSCGSRLCRARPATTSPSASRTARRTSSFAAYPTTSCIAWRRRGSAMGDGPFDKEPRRGPITLGTSKQRIVVNDRSIPPSGPADPRQRVHNARRTPEPYVDLVQTPILTGTYFEKRGRYRLFINHVGGHIECLLTLVNHHIRYHEPRKKGDLRIPRDWGVQATLGEHPRPLAFRFAGDLVGPVYELYVPSWIGKFELSPELYPGMPNDLVGHLTPKSGGGRLDVVFELPFVGRWPPGSFSLTADNTIETIAVKHDDQPVLLDRYLGHAAIPFALRTRYWFQLTPTQRSELGFYARGIVRNKVMVDPDTFRPVKSGGKPMRLYDLLMAERKLEQGYVGSQRRNAIVTAINRLVFDVFNYPLAEKRAEDKRLGHADLAELRLHVLRILDAWHLSPSEGRGKQSFGTALQRLVDGADEQYADFGSLVRYLGLGPRGYRKFRYEIEIELLKLVEFDDKETQQAYDTAKGAWKVFKKVLEEAAKKKSEAFAKYKSVSKYLPLTYLVGHATVSFKGVVAYADPNDEPADGEKADPPWTAEFGIALAGIKLSGGAGAGTSIKWSGVSEIRHATPLAKEAFEGTIGYAQGDAFAGSKGEIKDENGEVQASWGGAFGGSKSFLAFYGRNFEAPLTFGSTGSSPRARARASAARACSALPGCSRARTRTSIWRPKAKCCGTSTPTGAHASRRSGSTSRSTAPAFPCRPSAKRS